MELNSQLQDKQSSAQALLVSAKACYTGGDFSGSANYLKKYLAKKPEDHKTRARLIDVLKKLKDFTGAIHHMELLKRHMPQIKVSYQDYLENDNYAAALVELEKILQQSPDNLQALIHYADTLKTVGRTEEAILHYKQAMVIEPLCGASYWGLANLKSYAFNNSDIELMANVLAKPNVKEQDRMLINFALGKAYEDKQDYQQSFACYQQANQIKSIFEPYYKANIENFYESIKTHYTKTYFENTLSTGFKDCQPIFIVGLPRSGSTLTEQILSSHSMVDGTRELHFIHKLSRNLYFNKRYKNQKKTKQATPELKADLAQPFSIYPEIATTLTELDLETAGKIYQRDTMPLRNGAGYFTDKMPNNFMHIGFIQQILPNAKIIDVRRNPMAVGLSVFRQNFPKGLSFSNNLEDFAHFYTSYLDLMAHWDGVLPNKVYHLSYEALVQNPDEEIKKLLAYCELPFEQACIDFHQTKRAVKTPSAEQVRQPIYKDGLEQWQNYEKQLQTIKHLLEGK